MCLGDPASQHQFFGPFPKGFLDILDKEAAEEASDRREKGRLEHHDMVTQLGEHRSLKTMDHLGELRESCGL